MPDNSLAIDEQTVIITSDGDLVLCIVHDTDTKSHTASFRVSSSMLRSSSNFFQKLLSVDSFGEGARVGVVHDKLRSIYKNAGEAPLQELPVLHIEHIGRISSVKSVAALLSDFFSILHHNGSQNTSPAANLANLAIVADRFDALPTLGEHFHRIKAFQAVDRKTTSKQESVLTEEKIRQRILVGLLLHYAPWVERYSARLITRDRAADVLNLPDPLWWHLPGRVDEEVDLRRACVLQTVQDLQITYLELYSSRSRQCRLGYDSSAQCDSFQLGEMLRFFLRMGFVRLHGNLTPTEPSEDEYQGDLFGLIEQLRQVPEYQIDQNHSHCGLRTRIIPALTLLTTALSHIGICGDCWRERRSEHEWSAAKRPSSWGRSQYTPFGSATSHQHRHELVRSLFMAQERQWED